MGIRIRWHRPQEPHIVREYIPNLDKGLIAFLNDLAIGDIVIDKIVEI